MKITPKDLILKMKRYCFTFVYCLMLTRLNKSESYVILHVCTRNVQLKSKTAVVADVLVFSTYIINRFVCALFLGLFSWFHSLPQSKYYIFNEFKVNVVDALFFYFFCFIYLVWNSTGQQLQQLSCVSMLKNIQ